jgi:mono/diheme cytochrome c family protein
LVYNWIGEKRSNYSIHKEEKMKRIYFGIMISLIMVALVLSACGGKEANEGSTVPAEYASKTNPLAGQTDAVTAGKDIFDTNCASCHGEDAKGDGPAGVSLTPPPADLLEPASEDSDGEMFWRISLGNQIPDMQGSAMVSWKDQLSETQIWQVITYLRSLVGK